MSIGYVRGRSDLDQGFKKKKKKAFNYSTTTLIILSDAFADKISDVS